MNDSVLSATEVKKLCYFIDSFLTTEQNHFSKIAKTTM